MPNKKTTKTTNMSSTQLTSTELKSRAYDLILTIQRLNQQLQQTEQQLQETLREEYQTNNTEVKETS